MSRRAGNLNSGNGRRGGRGASWDKRLCARSLPFSVPTSGNAEAQEPTPGPSGEQTSPKSLTLTEEYKALKAARVLDAKSLARLSPDQKKKVSEARQAKQIGHFRMPDALEPKKRKDEDDKKVWVSCPLLPGVPTIPPPHVPQPFELQCARVIIKAEDTQQTILESDTPSRTTPRSKKRKMQFSPSMPILQETLTFVPVEFEYLGLTPTFTTSTTAPGSGRSAHDIDVSVDIEPEYPETGEASDIEADDNAVRDRTFVNDESWEDPALAKDIGDIDSAADSALRTAIRSNRDLLNFDWRCESEHFKGVREAFTVPCTGPTFDNTNITPLGVFFKIWDTNILDHIVRETNRYGRKQSSQNEKLNSRLTRWKDVSENDIRNFLAILMLQSLVINNVEREYWYPRIDELGFGNFKAIMTFNRFLIIKRCLHFVDNASLPVHTNRLHKIMPIIEHLNSKFSSLYVLEQNVAIDESLLLWKGRLTFAQKIATKKARVGIKSYELCESRTGYLWRMEVYSGKGHGHTAQEPVVEHEEGPECATSQLVLTLMRPLFDRGHTVVMDNFYNAPLLSRILKVQHKTDSMGTLRLSREFVPEGLKNKTKKNMKAGEVAFSMTEDLSVVVWMDKNVVPMISTFHPVQVDGIEKYGYYKYKPKVILDYNLSMGGIDHKDQMLHAFPIERSRNLVWYKKLFRRLINVSIHNAFVMFNHNRTKVVGNREFRLQLAQELLQMGRPVALLQPVTPVAPAAPAAPSAQSQMHLPVKNIRPQRCKMCSNAKVRRSTMWRCSTCSVNLCIDRCYFAYHTENF